MPPSCPLLRRTATHKRVWRSGAAGTAGLCRRENRADRLSRLGGTTSWQASVTKAQLAPHAALFGHAAMIMSMDLAKRMWARTLRGTAPNEMGDLRQIHLTKLARCSALSGSGRTAEHQLNGVLK